MLEWLNKIMGVGFKGIQTAAYLKKNGDQQKMTRTLEERDERCHICGFTTCMTIEIMLKDYTHIKIPVCVNHEPIRMDCVNANTGKLKGFDIEVTEIIYDFGLEEEAKNVINTPVDPFLKITNDNGKKHE